MPESLAFFETVRISLQNGTDSSIFVKFGGQEYYDGVRVLGLYQLAQLKTVAVRQVDVQQHQIKFPLADGVGCGSGI